MTFREKLRALLETVEMPPSLMAFQAALGIAFISGALSRDDNVSDEELNKLAGEINDLIESWGSH